MKKVIWIILIIVFVVGCGEKKDQPVKEKEETKKSEAKTVGDLPIGSLVVDTSWEWEIKANEGYSGNGLKKPLVWIVVAKDHYEVEGDEGHVTLLSEKIIGRYTFDNSTDRESENGSNHWGNSGTTNATRGVRTFLQNNFVKEFSNNFSSRVLITNLPSAKAQTDEIYYTQDKVFIPCRSEIDRDLRLFTAAGKILPYFDLDDVNEVYNRRKAQLPGLSNTDSTYKDLGDYWNYLTRTPASGQDSFIYRVVIDGNYSVGNSGDTTGFWGIRPLLNIKASTIVLESPDENGVYNIVNN